MTAAPDARCSGCGGERDRPGQRYCRQCHNAAMRRWRKRHHEEFELAVQELKAAAYGKNVSRETIEVFEKRSKRLP